MLLFDWSNRVIGYQDPDYASSAKFDSSPAPGWRGRRFAIAPERHPCPILDPGRMADLYAYAHLLRKRSAASRTT